MTWEGTYPRGYFGPESAVTLVTNLSTIVTGRLGDAPTQATQIQIRSGLIERIGNDLASDADIIIDARGATAIPGLIDTHCHVVFGDWTPRQNAIGYLESYMHGGVTEVVSASEVHLPGRPTDREGVKALAVTAQRAFSAFRPGGVRVMGGSLICEPDLVEADFSELAASGVRLMKVGFGRFTRPAEAAPLVAMARKAGFVVMCHSGGASIPGSAPIGVDDLLALQPNIAAHINGGTTSLPDADVLRLIETSDMTLQIVQAGNLRSSLMIVAAARERQALRRIVIGSDTPSGTGVMPLAVIKTVTEIASLGGFPASVAIAFATGNASEAVGLREGLLLPGRPADIVLLETPLGCSAPDALGAIERGDIPAIVAVLIDGVIRALKSRNTPAPSREVRLVKMGARLA